MISLFCDMRVTNKHGNDELTPTIVSFKDGYWVLRDDYDIVFDIGSNLNDLLKNNELVLEYSI